PLDAQDLVAQNAGLFVLLLLAVPLHLLFELRGQLPFFPPEKQAGLLNLGGVLLLGDVTHAGGGAGADLVVEARPIAVLELAVRAVADLEGLQKKAADLARAGAERAEVLKLGR